MLSSKAIALVFVGVSLTLLTATIQSKPTGTEINWLERKKEFYKNTTFQLSDANLRLFGGKFSPYHTGHLPFWFDFELYKTVFSKQYTDPSENLARHDAYIKRCVRVLKARVLFRILAGSDDASIDKDSDQLYEESKLQRDRRSGLNQEDGFSFSISFVPDKPHSAGQVESPLEKAVRLVREELDRVESRNQIENYLKAFNEIDGSAINAKLPY